MTSHRRNAWRAWSAITPRHWDRWSTLPPTGRLAGLVVAYTTPERDEPTEHDAPATPAVGEGEERLSRLGELEREVATLRERADSRARARRAGARAGRPPRRLSAFGATPGARGIRRLPAGEGLIGLDGRFESINPAFEALVGYSDADFRRARWPSLADREQVAANRALLTRLAHR